jgi:hypothetical protein
MSRQRSDDQSTEPPLELSTDHARWICKIQFFDPDYDQPCPRCGKACRWGCTITVFPRGPISQGMIHWPICACPDGHIRAALVSTIAEALVKDLLSP